MMYANFLATELRKLGYSPKYKPADDPFVEDDDIELTDQWVVQVGSEEEYYMLNQYFYDDNGELESSIRGKMVTNPSMIIAEIKKKVLK